MKPKSRRDFVDHPLFGHSYLTSHPVTTKNSNRKKVRQLSEFESHIMKAREHEMDLKAAIETSERLQVATFACTKKTQKALQDENKSSATQSTIQFQSNS